jgi:hypothetical protein
MKCLVRETDNPKPIDQLNADELLWRLNNSHNPIAYHWTKHSKCMQHSHEAKNRWTRLYWGFFFSRSKSLQSNSTDSDVGLIKYTASISGRGWRCSWRFSTTDKREQRERKREREKARKREKERERERKREKERESGTARI